MTTEVLLSTEDLLVVGPPTQINVDLDLGAKGERGSRIFSYDEPDPSIGMSDIEQTPVAYDVYVNTKQGEEYLTAYQYVWVPSVGYSWEKVFNFYPRQYRKNILIPFNNGVATKTIVVTEIIPLSELSTISAENFSITYGIESQNPIASSISSISLGPDPETDFVSLTFTINALEYKNNSWIPLGSDDEDDDLNIGSRIVHLDIRVV